MLCASILFWLHRFDSLDVIYTELIKIMQRITMRAAFVVAFGVHVTMRRHVFVDKTRTSH